MEKVIEKLNRSTAKQTFKYPTRIIQFGEGNFLRAFVDWMVSRMNQESDFNSGIKIIQPLNHGMAELINSQDGIYHVALNGYEGAQFMSQVDLIDCVNEVINPYSHFKKFLKCAEDESIQIIVSNTTEAGIAFDESNRPKNGVSDTFPGKLTQFLFHRYQTIPESERIVVLPCELIDKNGEKLQKTICQYIEHWNLGNYFQDWVNKKVTFCNTLVDRIVPGFPKDSIQKYWGQTGYQDEILVEAEYFHLWVIEGPDWIQEVLPAQKAGLNVVFTNDLDAYRTRKVRVLNGLHTVMVPVSYLYGLRTVKDTLEDDQLSFFLNEALFEEILPTLQGDEKQLEDYASKTLERFRNPAIKHQLISIALNSFSKFKTRVLPSILEYERLKSINPKRLLFALSALICFYQGEENGETIDLSDEPYIIEKMKALWNQNDYHEITNSVLSDKSIWGTDLSRFSELVENYVKSIDQLGMKESLRIIKF
ncbi:MAG: tagaturonate reductase [Bacteroidota bacterium]